MRKQRDREVKYLTQVHRAAKWQIQNANVLPLNPMLLIIRLYDSESRQREHELPGTKLGVPEHFCLENLGGPHWKAAVAQWKKGSMTWSFHSLGCSLSMCELRSFQSSDSQQYCSVEEALDIYGSMFVFSCHCAKSLYVKIKVVL